MARTWAGDVPHTCQLCQRPIVRQFVDGKTVYGPWAIMCLSCHQSKGCGLGTGKGQKYVARRNPDTADDEWIKTDG